MDQIVFVIDLESFMPRTFDQTQVDKFLTNVKKALIRILTHGRIIERPDDLSSFGFRFYSSTEYFSTPSQISGDWFDLSLSSWGILEDALSQIFKSVTEILQRTPPGARLRGKQTPGAALCKVLEEVTALYSWDRPALFYPINSVNKSELKFGNSVFVITKLPVDDLELQKFINNDKQVKDKVRDIVDAITSKRIKNHFTDLNISLHILNTVEDDFNPDIIQLFNKALKEFKGGVLQLSSLSGCSSISNIASNPILLPSNHTCSLPATCLFTCHLSESSLPVKMLARNYYGQGEMTLDNNVVIKVEFISNDQSRQLSSGLRGLGVTSVKMFTSVQRWLQSVCVWSQDHNDHGLVSLLTYLHHSQQCLVLEDPNQQIFVMFPSSKFSGIVASLDKVESHFYHKQMSHQSSTSMKEVSSKELETILGNIESLQLRKSESPIKSKPSLVRGFDFSSLEPWRLPNNTNPSFLEKISITKESQNWMLRVRESYNSSTGIQFENNKSSAVSGENKAEPVDKSLETKKKDDNNNLPPGFCVVQKNTKQKSWKEYRDKNWKRYKMDEDGNLVPWAKIKAKSIMEIPDQENPEAASKLMLPPSDPPPLTKCSSKSPVKTTPEEDEDSKQSVDSRVNLEPSPSSGSSSGDGSRIQENVTQSQGPLVGKRKIVGQECFKCGQVCSNANLKNHILSHYYKVFFPILPDRKPYQCPTCHVISRDRITLVRHYAFGHKKFSEFTGVTLEKISRGVQRKKRDDSHGGKDKKSKEDSQDKYEARPKRRTRMEIEKENLLKVKNFLAITDDRTHGLEITDVASKGRGIKAVRMIGIGEYVVEYSGDLLLKGEAKHADSLDVMMSCYMFYFKHHEKQYCIDATRDTGRFGRLVNHSRLKPNCIPKVVEIDNIPHLLLVAKNDIEAGEELLYDYGDRSRESLKAFPWLAL